MATIIGCWRWFVKALRESHLENPRKEIDGLGDFDLHDILRQQTEVGWSEWHLNIDENDIAIKIANKFHQNFKEIEETSSIIDQVQTIEETFLRFMPKDVGWNEIRNYFKQAREQNNPSLIIKAYTASQDLSSRLNMHSAVNTYHALKFYCTLLNCPILARTQEYTEAFTRILFHPKLNPYLVRQGTYYRGITLKDKKLVENYKEGATIITTTFLSTSSDPRVANIFSNTDSNTADPSSGNYPNASNPSSAGDFYAADRFNNRNFNVADRFNGRDSYVPDRFSARDFSASDRFNRRDLHVTNRYSGVDIDTTNYLSGTDPNASDSASGTTLENAISISCTYNINNTNRRTALNITNLSKFVGEEEILILRYIPFKITSIERTDDGRRMKICFDECKEEFTEEEETPFETTSRLMNYILGNRS